MKDKVECLDKSLKPFALTKLHSPMDLWLWMKQVREYFCSGGIHKDNPDKEMIQMQHTHLAQCLDVEVLKMLDQRVYSN